MEQWDSTFKERFTVLMNDTTLHGVKHVVKNCSIVRRILWGFAFIISASYLMSGAVELFLEFSRKPVVTKTHLKQRNNLQFPSVTICNKNTFRKDIVEQYSIQYNTDALKDLLAGAFSINPKQKNHTRFNWTDPSYGMFLNDSFPWEKFLEESAHPLDMSLLSCMWHKKDVKCSDYFETKLTSIGYCFVFNANGSLHSYIGGTSGGLSIVLDTQAYHYYFGRKSYSAGFQILLHYPDEEPLVDELGFYVAPGTDMFVSMQKFEADYLPYPAENSTCQNLDSPDFVNPLTYFSKYSNNGCLIECKTKFILKMCGCKDIFQPDLFPHASDGLSACSCPVGCHQVSYNPQLSQNLFPSDTWILGFNITPAVIQGLKLNYDYIKELYGYSSTKLVADLGGYLGLCVGASLLTVLESVEFGWLELVHFIKTRCCKKKQQVHVQQAVDEK